MSGPYAGVGVYIAIVHVAYSKYRYASFYERVVYTK